MSKPFVPSSSLAPWRIALTGAVVVAGAVLLYSLSRDWWVVEDWEREATITTGAESPLVRTIVGVGVVAAGFAVAALWGRRNWTPPALLLAWMLVGFSWAFESTGEATDSDASGEALSGLTLATWALLALTILVVLVSLGRVAERRAGPVLSGRGP